MWRRLETAPENTPVIVIGAWELDQTDWMNVMVTTAMKRSDRIGVWWRSNEGYGFTVRCYPVAWMPLTEPAV